MQRVQEVQEVQGGRGAVMEVKVEQEVCDTKVEDVEDKLEGLVVEDVNERTNETSISVEDQNTSDISSGLLGSKLFP